MKKKMYMVLGILNGIVFVLMSIGFVVSILTGHNPHWVCEYYGVMVGFMLVFDLVFWRLFIYPEW